MRILQGNTEGPGAAGGEGAELITRKLPTLAPKVAAMRGMANGMDRIGGGEDFLPTFTGPSSSTRFSFTRSEITTGLIHWCLSPGLSPTCRLFLCGWTAVGCIWDTYWRFIIHFSPLPSTFGSPTSRVTLDPLISRESLHR